MQKYQQNESIPLLKHQWSLQEPPKIPEELEDSCINKLPSLKKTRSMMTVKWINLLTYNIFLRPPLITNNGNDYKNERLSLFKKELYQFDIINFQEIFQTLNERKAEMIKFSKKTGLKWTANSPRFPFFSKFLIDSGLLTVSRYRMLEVDFTPFEYNAGVDGLAYKGVLYTKIELEKNGRSLHLFNIHTQASYSTKYTRDQHKHFESRLNQLIAARETIEKFLKKYSNLEKVGPANFNDIILIAGDFNVDARGHPIPKNFRLKCPTASEFLKSHDPKTLTEYNLLMYVLSGYEKDKVVDFLKESYGGKHPATYADVKIEREKEIPGETVLTDKDDLMSQQCLDYVFQILPGKVMEHKLKAVCRIRPFLVEGKDFSQLSDHYGVQLSFKLS